MICRLAIRRTKRAIGAFNNGSAPAGWTGSYNGSRKTSAIAARSI
jgi:hypothetical protein